MAFIGAVMPHPKSSSLKIVGDSKLHPSFCSPDADIILCASDDVIYRMHSYTLRMASGFFRDLLTLPQPSPVSNLLEAAVGSLTTSEKTESSTGILIPIPETSDILTLFLILISGTVSIAPLHEWNPSSSASSNARSCFDVIERVLHLAENWEAAGPLSYIRLGLRSAELVNLDPLRLYAIASHFGWEYERSWAAQHTLKLDLFHASSAVLEGLSSKDLLCLLRLRYRRKESFRELLDQPERFSAGNSDGTLCTKCNETPVNNQTWNALKHAMVMEMDRRPLGDSIVGFEVDGIGGEDFVGGILAWPEAQACFDARCVKEGCGGLNYDKCATLKLIQSCVDELPWDL